MRCPTLPRSRDVFVEVLCKSVLFLRSDARLWPFSAAVTMGGFSIVRSSQLRVCADGGFRVTSAKDPRVMLLVVVSLWCCRVSGLAGTPLHRALHPPPEAHAACPCVPALVAPCWVVGGGSLCGLSEGLVMWGRCLVTSAPDSACERGVAAPFHIVVRTRALAQEAVGQ